MLNGGNSVDRAQTYACNLGNVGVNSLDAGTVEARGIEGLVVSGESFELKDTSLSLPRSVLSLKAIPTPYVLDDTHAAFVVNGAAFLNYKPLPRFAVGQVIEFVCSGQVETNDGIKDYIIAPWFKTSTPASQADIYAGLDLQATDQFPTSYEFSSIITITAVTPTTISFGYSSRSQRSWKNVDHEDLTNCESGEHDNVPYDSSAGETPFTSIVINIGDGGIAAGKSVQVVVLTSYVRLLAGPSGYVLPVV
jgi:hypothetical protein